MCCFLWICLWFPTNGCSENCLWTPSDKHTTNQREKACNGQFKNWKISPRLLVSVWLYKSAEYSCVKDPGQRGTINELQNDLWFFCKRSVVWFMTETVRIRATIKQLLSISSVLHSNSIKPAPMNGDVKTWLRKELCYCLSVSFGAKWVTDISLRSLKNCVNLEKKNDIVPFLWGFEMIEQNQCA